MKPRQHSPGGNLRGPATRRVPSAALNTAFGAKSVTSRADISSVACLISRPASRGVAA
ncbi:Hypothetical protein BJL86_2671 [Dietzia timorensis]|uniref:Uncharacterized protein n=1 Tax=Dietzia timorensis TaxID=499555 RepID=A0A173LPJ9_9ACTN|nr:Hypothetical protein BJL86_2671 [Dietzia timorensis]